MIILAVIVLGLLLIPDKIHGDSRSGLLWINPLESLPEQPNPALIRSALSYISVKYSLSYDKLMDTIECESNFRYDAKNPHSTASGVAQFIDGTWKLYCKGDKSSAKDQLTCLGEMFNKGLEHHWECYNRLYGY